MMDLVSVCRRCTNGALLTPEPVDKNELAALAAEDDEDDWAYEGEPREGRYGEEEEAPPPPPPPPSPLPMTSTDVGAELRRRRSAAAAAAASCTCAPSVGGKGELADSMKALDMERDGDARAVLEEEGGNDADADVDNGDVENGDVDNGGGDNGDGDNGDDANKGFAACIDGVVLVLVLMVVVVVVFARALVFMLLPPRSPPRSPPPPSNRRFPSGDEGSDREPGEKVTR